MRKYIILSVIFLLFSFLTYSQDEHNHENNHSHPELEFGFSNVLVYNVTEKEAAYGIHVHVIKTVSKSDKFGLGLAYEAIFDDHKHNAASFILFYRPVEHLSFNLSPGVSWLATESKSLRPAMHIEGLYEWELGSFHFGPLVGVAFNTEDLHVSTGIHMAIGF